MPIVRANPARPGRVIELPVIAIEAINKTMLRSRAMTEMTPATR